MNVIQQITPAQAAVRRTELSLRFRQRLRDRSATRRAAGRTQLAAALRRTASMPSSSAARLSPRPRATNERSWLYRIRPTVAALGPLHQGRYRPLAHSARRSKSELPTRAAPLGPDPHSQRVRLLLAGRAHDHDGGRRRHASRHGRAYLPDHALHAGRVFLQCRRRTAVRAAAGRAPALDRVRHHRYRAGRDRGHSARREVARSSSRTARRAAICARTTAAPSPCRSVARSAPTASPIRATS